jgi:hypothetical protein
MFPQLKRARALLFGVTVLVVAPAFASALAAEPAKDAKDEKATIINGEGVDESALRFYASRNQTDRVNAEIKRLERLYPGWRPPEDLYNTAPLGGPDEQVLWDLFGADRLEDLQAAIEVRQKAEPGWQPSADLEQKFQRKKARRKIAALRKDGQWEDLVDFVKANGLGDEGDLDLAWTVAEAYTKVKQPGNALAVYKTILGGKANPEQRAATIQKAIATLRMGDVETLIAMGRKDPLGRSEFDNILPDIARARISAFLHAEREEPVSPADMKAFEEQATKADDANQPALAAWYYFKRRDYNQALTWFKLSVERGGDAMVAHGLANTLKELGLLREAEEVAYAWRESLANNAILFIDILETQLTKEVPPYIEPERLTRYAQVTSETASGEGAQALAWYAYNSCQFDVAAQWFQRALAWFPKEGTAMGYALSMQRQAKRKEMLEIINRYDGLFPSVVGLLFPDELARAPTPCETSPGARQAGNASAQAQIFSGATTGQRFLVPTGPGGNARDPRLNRGFGSVPSPQGGAVTGAPPPIDRKEFPVSTAPENPFRFAATRTESGERNPSPASPAIGLAYAREPFAGPWPLIAGRVPGVGPMPYERYGFELLPGYNGITKASWPPASAQIAAAGTLWSQDAVDRMRVGAFGDDQRRQGAPVNQQQAPSGAAAPNFPVRNR